MANVTVRSKPFGPVMRTRNPPLNGSAAIHASCGALVCLPPATTAASMRSRRWPGTPLMSKTVTGIRLNCSDSGRPWLLLIAKTPIGGMSFRLRLNTIPDRAYPLGKLRDVNSASNRLRFSGIL